MPWRRTEVALVEHSRLAVARSAKAQTARETMARTGTWLRGLLPRQTPMLTHERLLACLGALIGIALTALISRWCLGAGFPLPLLIAPMGASAVLVFAVPASPLAQPWSVVMGNGLSALAGVTCAELIADPTLAAACAVASAIGLMSLARCVHPPGGAVALTAVLGGPAIANAGYAFALAPVALNSLVLVGVGLAFNNATRRQYPHVPPPPVDHRTADLPPQERAGFSLDDIDRALERYGETLDVSREDLDALFREVALEAHRRRHGKVTCAMIMARDVVGVTPDDTPERARALLHEHALRVLPVLDHGRVVGAVTAGSLYAGATSVSALMQTALARAAPTTPIGELLDVLSRGAHHEVWVVDADDLLVGVVTQTDLLAALYRARVVDAS